MREEKPATTRPRIRPTCREKNSAFCIFPPLKNTICKKNVYKKKKKHEQIRWFFRFFLILTAEETNNQNEH
jgi:hypothetical protein